MSPFTVTLLWDVEEGVEVELTVEGDYATGGGNLSGHPDTWTEAWTELDIKSIKNQKGCPLPPLVVEKLVAQDAFLRAVESRILEDDHGN